MAADGSDLAPTGTGHFLLLDALPCPVDGYRWHANEGDDQQEPIGAEDIHAGSLVCLGCLSQVSGLQRIDSVDVRTEHALVGLVARRILCQRNQTGGTATLLRTGSFLLPHGQQVDHGSDEDHHAEDEEAGSELDEFQLRELLYHFTET